MRKWIALTTLGTCLFVAALQIVVTPRRTVANIAIQETLFDSQTMLQNYRYRQFVRGALDGDSGAFARLVRFPCSGAGSYEHGEVLAAILINLGDKQFARMAATLTQEDRKRLIDLLAAGFEYGTVGNSKGLPGFSNTYPQVSELLRNMNGYATLQ